MSDEQQQTAIPNLNAAQLPDRNSQCRCGSGKKYKKCCLYEDQTKLQQARQFIGENYGGRVSILPDLSNSPLYPWLRHGYPGVGKYKRVDPQSHEPVATLPQTELNPIHQVPEPPTEVTPTPVE